MKLSNEQNILFANDKRRVEAEKRLRGLVSHIQSSVKIGCPNAGYYLTVLPPLLKQLQEAQENLIIVEATIESELMGKERWHG